MKVDSALHRFAAYPKVLFCARALNNRESHRFNAIHEMQNSLAFVRHKLLRTQAKGWPRLVFAQKSGVFTEIWFAQIYVTILRSTQNICLRGIRRTLENTTNDFPGFAHMGRLRVMFAQ